MVVVQLPWLCSCHGDKCCLQSEPFQKPVDMASLPTYRDYIVHPVDLGLIEKVRLTESLTRDTNAD